MTGHGDGLRCPDYGEFGKPSPQLRGRYALTQVECLHSQHVMVTLDCQA